jgi:hypothetical protein
MSTEKDIAKAYAFGVAYGGTPEYVARQLGISDADRTASSANGVTGIR